MGAVSKRFVPSPALVVSVIVLIVTLGGVAWGAAKAPKNSVISKSVKNNSLKGKDVRDGKLKGADVGDDSLTGADIDESTLVLPQQPQQAQQGALGPAGGDLTGTYPNPTIAANAVGSAEIADNAVGGTELAADSVANSEITNNAVNSANVVDSSLTGADINDGSVGTADIANGSVTGLDVDDGTLTGTDISDGSVGTADIANGSVTGADVDDGTIGSADVADNSLGAADINESTLPFSRAGRNSTVGTFTTDADIATQTIQVPAGGGIAWVTASAQLGAPGDVGGALIECRLDINENDIPVTERVISVGESEAGQCATNWAQSVGQGAQTFNLEVTSLGPNEEARNPVLQVMFVPFNQDGN